MKNIHMEQRESLFDRLAGCWCRGNFEATACIEKLSRYEDTGLEPEEILTGVQLAEIACMRDPIQENAETIGAGSGRNRELQWTGN